MKVAFDYKIFAGQEYGGISRYFVKLAESLLPLNPDLAIFAPQYKNKYLADLPAEKVSGRPAGAFALKHDSVLDLYRKITSAAAMKFWQPAVVHETYYSDFNIAPAACPKVVTVHDMIYEKYPQQFTRDLPFIATRKKAILRADHIICVSEHTRQDLIQLFQLDPAKTSVVYHGTDRLPVMDHGVPADIVGSPYLLYVGQRSGYKNFNGFLQAVAGSTALRQDFKIVVFGGPLWNAEETLLISQLGFHPGRIIQMGGADSVLHSLYCHASAFVYPSFYEGFGFPPLEAMARNCPVVASHSSCLPEVLGPAAAYFPPEDPLAMAAAIESVVYCDETMALLRSHGQQQIKKYSWEQCAAQTLSVYQKMAGL